MSAIHMPKIGIPGVRNLSFVVSRPRLIRDNAVGKVAAILQSLAVLSDQTLSSERPPFGQMENLRCVCKLNNNIDFDGWRRLC
jgi:hypothetical protein